MRARMLAWAVILIPLAAGSAASQTLTVSVTGQGKVTGSGIDCPSDCSENLPNVPARIVVGRRGGPSSRTVTLTATPNAGSAFKGWSGGCAEPSAPTCTVTIPSGGAVTVSAEFIVAAASIASARPAASDPPVVGSSAASAAQPFAIVDARVLEALEGARDPVSMETVALTADPRDPKVAGPDLTVARISLDADGRIRYTAANATFGGSINPFVADVLVDDERKDTIKHPQLAAHTSHLVTTATVFPDCGTHTIRVVLDPQEIVTETTENNNARNESLTPPCPDLAVTEIKKNWEDLNTQYRAHVTIQNVGDLVSPPGIIMTVSVSGAGIPTEIGYELDPLQPGQSRSFNVSEKVNGLNSIEVYVWIDREERLPEKSEANNKVVKDL
jgi:hypothetical protein